jgi:hypothetical protein
MAVTARNDRRRNEGTQSHRRKRNIEAKKNGGQGNTGQEITVRHEAVPQRKEKSTFSWFEEFIIEWSETFISKN